MKRRREGKKGFLDLYPRSIYTTQKQTARRGNVRKWTYMRRKKVMAQLSAL